MQTLIILNYQREIPPFMITEISYAKKMFDNVYYVTPELFNDNSLLVTCDNVHVVQLGIGSRIKSCLKLPFMLLRKASVKQIYSAIKNHDISFKLIKYIITQLFCSDIIYNAGRKIVEKNLKITKIYVMATWFSVEAYAAAMLKNKYSKNITTASLAHSFEIDPAKNNFVEYSFNDEKHCAIDKISFISQKMKDIYYNAVGEVLKDEWNKGDCYYLGSIKKYDCMNQTDETVFNICTCSGMTAVKRIPLLIEALMGWENSTLVWTHLGGGPLENEIVHLSDKLQQTNPLITVKLLGKLENSKVQKYYANNPVDLFINVSEAEGLPVSIMEAMSYGIPVLATDVGGTSEIVNTSNGLLIQKEMTPGELHDSITLFYMKTFDFRNELRENAYEFWNKKFNASKNITKYFEDLILGTCDLHGEKQS